MRSNQLLTNLIPQINWHRNYYYSYIYALSLYLGVYYYARRWWAVEVIKVE
jgi:hypothetical protein